MSAFKQLVVIVRPWERRLFPQIVARLKTLPEFRGAQVVWITAWKHLVSPFSAVDLTRQIQETPRPTAQDRVWLRGLDRALQRNGSVPLQTMLQNDRFRPDGADAGLDFLYQHARTLDGLIGERSFLLCGAVDYLAYWIAAELCLMRGGAFVGPMVYGRPAGHTSLCSSPTTLWLQREPKARHLAEARRQFEAIDSGKKPDYMCDYGQGMPTPTQRLRLRAETYAEAYRGNYLVRPFLAANRLDHRQATLKWAWQRRLIDSRPLSAFTRDFVYFPLHLQPEASTLVHAPMLVDQVSVAENVARSLPAGVDLLVKENPKMWGRRGDHFYRRMATSRAVWVDPTVPGVEVIRKARATVVITGTSGIEAALMGARIAVLGTPPWQDALRCVPRLHVDHRLGRELERLLDGALDIPRDTLERDYARFVANMVPRGFLAARVVKGRRQIDPHPDFGEWIADIAVWAAAHKHHRGKPVQ